MQKMTSGQKSAVREEFDDGLTEVTGHFPVAGTVRRLVAQAVALALMRDIVR